MTLLVEPRLSSDRRATSEDPVCFQPRRPTDDSAPPAKTRSLGRRVRRIVVGIGSLYLGFVTLLFSFQEQIIFPGHNRQGKPDTIVADPPPGLKIVVISRPGEPRLVALHAVALDKHRRAFADPASRPWILYFYGNAMCLNDTIDREVEMFREMGANVVVPDYPGFGMSDGRPGEKGCYLAAARCYEYITDYQKKNRKANEPRGAIVVAGWSLGGAVAIDLASKVKVDGVIALSTFTSLVEMSRRNFPLIPARLLLKLRFDSLSKIKTIGAPILLVHGESDPFIPAAMSAKLERAALGKVERITIPGAGHNDVFEIGGGKLENGIHNFLNMITAEPYTDDPRSDFAD